MKVWLRVGPVGSETCLGLSPCPWMYNQSGQSWQSGKQTSQPHWERPARNPWNSPRSIPPPKTQLTCGDEKRYKREGSGSHFPNWVTSQVPTKHRQMQTLGIRSLWHMYSYPSLLQMNARRSMHPQEVGNTVHHLKDCLKEAVCVDMLQKITLVHIDVSQTGWARRSKCYRR